MISNLTGAIAKASKPIREKMIALFYQCDQHYGKRIEVGLEKIIG